MVLHLKAAAIASPTLLKRTVRPMEHRRVALRAFTALAEICNGTARTEEIIDLCDSINVVEALVTIGKCDDDSAPEHILKAMDGVRVAVKCPSGMMRMGQASTFSMRHIVTLHDLAVGRLSQGTLFEAWQLVMDKIADPAANESTGLFVVHA